MTTDNNNDDTVPPALDLEQWSTEMIDNALKEHIALINEQVEYVNDLISATTTVVQKFCLDVGTKYVTHSNDLVEIAYQTQNRFLGLVNSEGNLPFPIWYTADGYVDRNFDENIEQDPFDIKKTYREADVVYLLRNNGKYASNNCFMSYEAAAEAASTRGGRVIAFREIMED